MKCIKIKTEFGIVYELSQRDRGHRFWTRIEIAERRANSLPDWPKHAAALVRQARTRLRREIVRVRMIGLRRRLPRAKPRPNMTVAK